MSRQRSAGLRASPECMSKLSVFLLAGIALGAQTQPQLVWEGEVDGVIVIHIRGNRLDVEDRQGAPVQRERHRFFDRLPEARQTAKLRVVQSRGSVRVLNQPDVANNFTLSVMIEDRLGGSGFYSLAFFWQTSSHSGLGPVVRPPNRSIRSGEERLTWTGQIDEEVIIQCRANECTPQTVRGSSARGDRYQFSRSLPGSEVRVSLDDVQGRGDVQLIEQPAPQNAYMAKVRIRDQESGYGEYSFSLFWPRLSRNEPERLFARPGLTWSGRVDGTVRVVAQESSAVAQSLTGAAVEAERISFVRPLPREPLPNASIKKLRGRGRVEIVEFPSPRNSWRLVFEINDSSGGADNYEVEVGW
jgi:hypothetical protein